MKIKVPYTYIAQVIKPNCRKETPVLIQDSITVNIKEFDTLPVALRAEGVDYLWDNKFLWTINYNDSIHDKQVTVTALEVKENTENYGKNYKWSKSGTEAPFFSFWWDAKIALEEGETVLLKDEVIKNNKLYVSDNKDEVVNKIKAIAKNMCFINGIVYEKAIEPRYYIITFGMGNNHGGTSLSICSYPNPNIKTYFSALQYEEAKADTLKVAKRRRDTESIPRIGEDKIEVLIPDAVKLKIKKLKLKY